MMSDEEKTFVVRDRRGRTEEPSPSSAAPHTESGERGPQASRESTGTTSTHEQAPPVTFSSFVFSLSTSAMMLMGEQLDPAQPRVPVNLAQAKEIIDILSMLEEKTRGNLSGDEQAVLPDMLYALRMKYVDMASGKPATH